MMRCIYYHGNSGVQWLYYWRNIPKPEIIIGKGKVIQLEVQCGPDGG